MRPTKSSGLPPFLPLALSGAQAERPGTLIARAEFWHE